MSIPLSRLREAYRRGYALDNEYSFRIPPRGPIRDAYALGWAHRDQGLPRDSAAVDQIAGEVG